MMTLLRLVSLRHFVRHRMRTVLTSLGIILGVAVFVSVRIVNTSVIDSFGSTIDKIAGKTALTVDDGSSSVGDAGTGVPEELLDLVRSIAAVQTAVPVISENVRVPKFGGIELAVLAVDTVADDEVRDYEIKADQADIPDPLTFLSNEDSILITRTFAEKHGLKVDDTLELLTFKGLKAFTVRGLLEPEGPARVFGGDLAVMDIFAAQIVFGREGRFDRIDVVPKDVSEVAHLEKVIEARLDGRAMVRRPERRTKEAERLLAGFSLGLTITSLVALLVGIFIIYNAVAVSVAQRTHDIGILRALGVSRRAIQSLFLSEGLMLGFFGSVLGLITGVGLARVVLEGVTKTVSGIYVRVDNAFLSLTTFDAVAGLAAGTGAALLAALLPARKASMVDPAVTLHHRADPSLLATVRLRGSLLIASVLALAALAIAVAARIHQNHFLGYLVSVALSLMAAFLCPAVGIILSSAGRGVSNVLGPSVRLGLEGFSRNAGRNAITVAALALALGNAVSISGFITSMKGSLIGWLERSVSADIVLFAGDEVKAKFENPLPAELEGELEALPGVDFAHPFRIVSASFRDQPIYYIAMNYDEYLRHNSIPILKGTIEAALPALRDGSGIAASESFVQQFDLGYGDTIQLMTPKGPHAFKIVLEYTDYTADVGILAMERAFYVATFGDTLASTYGVYLKPNADANGVREEIVTRFGAKYGLLALANREYKRQILTLVDELFSVIYALEIIAIIVAILGIANTLLMAVMDRTREIGILRAIGASRRQIGRILMTEAALIGFAASIVGVCLGSLTSLHTVKEVIIYQAGFHMTYFYPVGTALSAFVLAQVVSWIASIWPTRHATQTPIVDALEYE